MKKTYLALFFFLVQSFILAQSTEWQWQNAKPFGNNLWDVHALSSTRIIAFGAAGLVALSNDAGETWQSSFPDASRKDILGSYFFDANTGFIVGGTASNGNLMMKTTDGGATWVAKNPTTTNILYDIEFYDALNGIACGAAGTVIRTTDGGNTWTAITVGLTTQSDYKVSIVSSSVVYVGSSSSSQYLFKSTDFGLSFTNVTPAAITSTVYSFYKLDTLTYFAGTGSNGIIITTDGGTTWNQKQASSNTIYDIKFNSSNGFAIDSKGIVWTSTNSGSSWTSSQLPTALALRQMDVTSANFFFVGDGGSIFKSTNTGNTWIAKFSTAAQQQMRKIIFKDDNNGWAGECPTSGNSKLIHTTDGGQSWSTLYTILNPIYSISMPTSTTWYVGCSNNTIYKTTDGGGSFFAQTQPLSGATFWSIGFADSVNGYAGAASGKVLKTTNGGTNWIDISTNAGFSGTINEMAVIDANTVIMIGGSRIAKTTNGGTSAFTVLSVPIAGSYFTVKFIDSNIGFLGAASLGVAKTTNGGTVWTQATLPSSPPAPAASIWGFAISGSNVWASTVNGDILYSIDGGANFTVAKKPASGVTYNFAVSNNNLWGCGANGDIIKGYVNPFTPTLNLTALIDGFYNSVADIMVSDTATVVLHNEISPYTIVESQKGVLNTSGSGTFNFSTAVNGTPYYIAVKHRNAVETWSASPITFVSGAASYNFTTAIEQAYAGNLHLNNGKYCLYSGDVNQDSVVNLQDMIVVDNDNTHTRTGYLNSDTNGDGVINLLDMVLVDNSNSHSIRMHSPGLPKEVKPILPIQSKYQNRLRNNNTK